MYTRFLCFAALLGTFLPALVTAQTNPNSISFTWGDYYDLPKGHEDIGFIGNAKHGYIQAGHDRRKSLSLQKFSPALKLLSEKSIDLSNLPKDYTSETFIDMGNKHYWLFSTWEDDQQRLYAQEIDLDNNDFNGDAKELLVTTRLAGTMEVHGMFSFGVGNKFSFYFSGDHSKMLVQYRKVPEKKNDKVNKDQIGFVVLDQNMGLLWQREITMPYTEEKMDNEDYQVDNNGAVYTLAKVYNTTASNKKSYAFRCELLKWTSDKAEVTKIPFRFTDKYVRSVMVGEDPRGGRLIVTGYYSDLNAATLKNNVELAWKHGSTAGINGVFILGLAEDGNELKDIYKGVYEFPASVLKEYESKRQQKKVDKKGEEGVEDLYLKEFVLNGNGSIQLYGEEYLMKTRTYYSNGHSSSSTTYYYNDILAVNIDSDGELTWVKKIPKAQSGKRGLGGLSFKSFTTKDKFYFFFFDNMKNLDIKPTETPAGHMDGAGGILMAVKIDKEGKMEKSSVFDVREEKKKLIPNDFVRVSPTEMIVRAKGKKGSQIALFTFSDN